MLFFHLGTEMEMSFAKCSPERDKVLDLSDVKSYLQQIKVEQCAIILLSSRQWNGISPHLFLMKEINVYLFLT